MILAVILIWWLELNLPNRHIKIMAKCTTHTVFSELVKLNCREYIVVKTLSILLQFISYDNSAY